MIDSYFNDLMLSSGRCIWSPKSSSDFSHQLVFNLSIYWAEAELFFAVLLSKPRKLNETLHGKLSESRRQMKTIALIRALASVATWVREMIVEPQE